MSTLRCLKKPVSTLENDVIFNEILPRLPAKSLLRFKCVSKSFNSVISSRHFHKLYLRYNPSDLLILSKDGRIKCYDLDSTTATAAFTLNDGAPISVVGSANGVLCIYTPNATNQLLLLNPTTRMYRDIPNVPGYPNGIIHQVTVGGLIGLAFDHQNNDFKIVRIFDAHQLELIKRRVTKVYSLNNNSWVEVGSEFHMVKVERELRRDSIQGCYGTYGGTLINTHLLHWMFWNNILRKRRIGCFDVCKNKWVDDVLLPHYYYDPAEGKLLLLNIGVLDDRLFSSFQTVGNRYNVWVMKEYGVQDSWIKLFDIPIGNGVGILRGVVPLASRVLVGDILLQQRYETWLFWYNLMDGGRTDAKYDGTRDLSELQVSICARSQIDIPGGELFEDPQEVPV